MKKTILVTLGPIPSKLDSVKYLGNRFKGGLSLKTATLLSKEHKVTLVAWRYADILKQVNDQLANFEEVILIDDVMEYYDKVLEKEYDAYVLSAAVANLMPSEVIPGKFPSHNYNVGDKFNIEFTIAPRVIDQIRVKYPKSRLVGYKLFDGSLEDLIYAGKKTLKESKAHIVFANTPQDAKTHKYAITSTGHFQVSFDEHVNLISELVKCDFTKSIQNESLGSYSNDTLTSFLTGEKHGCVAYRDIETEQVFISARLDKSSMLAVNFKDDMTIEYGSDKPSAMGLFYNQIFKNNPKIRYCLHRHDFSGEGQYTYPFTQQFNKLAEKESRNNSKLFTIDLPHHGYVLCSESPEELKEIVREIQDGKIRNMAELQEAISSQIS